MRIAVCIPSRGNPDLLKASVLSFDQMASGGHEIDYRIIYDEDDRETAAAAESLSGRLLSRSRAIPLSTPRLPFLGDYWTKVALAAPADLYMQGADDFFCLTLGWDRVLAAYFGGSYDLICSWFDRGLPGLPGCFVITQKWLDVAGYFMCGHFPYWFSDMWLWEVATFAFGHEPFIDGQLQLFSRQDHTQRLKDLDFWWGFFNATREKRKKEARIIAERLDRPFTDTDWFHIKQNERDLHFRGALIARIEAERADHSDPVSSSYQAALDAAKAYLAEENINLWSDKPIPDKTGAVAEGGHPPTEDPARGAAEAAVQPSDSDLFAVAAVHHQAGRLAEAEAHYRRILTIMPDHGGALHLLGVIAYQRGYPDMAAQLIVRAIERDESDPSYFVSYGLALHSLGRLGESIASYDRALSLQPNYPEALNNRGLALAELERFTEALESYDRALAVRPNYVEALNNRGNALQMLGYFAQAVESYDQALALRPDLVEAYFNRGDALRDLGRLDDARASYDRTLALKPDFPETFFHRGDALRDSGQLEDAVANYDQALVLKPNYPEAWLNRGVALEQLERFDEALESYDRALAARPHFVEAHYSRGNALRQLRLYENALQSYDQALAFAPDFAEALNNRGLALAELERFDEALESYDRALAIKPDYAEALNNRGSTLDELKRYDEALESYDRALAVKPDYAETLNNCGIVLTRLGRFNDALQSFDRALTAKPGYLGALSNRGVALRELGRLEEALESYDRALAVKPDFAEALNNRGSILGELGRLDEAIQSYERLLAIESDVDEVLTAWFHAKQQLCDWSAYYEGEERARNAIRTRASLGMEFKLLALSSTLEEQLDCARRVAAKIVVPKSAMLPHRQPRPSERVRLGYLSANFYQHPTASLIAGVIERHDRRDFEVVGYSYGPATEDRMRARLSAGFDRFVDIGKVSHRQAAELIRADAVDILIDLTGFTRDCRPAILAHRPAPIQVNYLGYPGTMGADFIDYIIVDPFVAPPDQQPFFNERLVHLPDCYQCNDDAREIAGRTLLRAECDLPEQGFVFCCFNNGYKITPAFFDVWMRLLHAVPNSVLWLLDTNRWAKANLTREAASRGIVPERLIFASKLPPSEHLARHRLADLFLDTLPYNAHTTASDALWAGLPVLTCAGKTFAGRVAGSLLRAVGLDELVTTSLEEYEALALQLARDGEMLSRLRMRLAQNRRTYPLFDTERCTRNLETAYLRMWERWKARCPPAAFAVS